MGRAAIIDAGLGNIGSVANMCRKLGVDADIARDPEPLATATHLLMPGVGAFDAGIARLEQSGILPAVERRVADGVPLLGICLGMQLLFDGSDEGSSPGLGWIPGRVRQLASDTAGGRVRIPHMGWNTLDIVRPSPLLATLDPDARFYFVHSFASVPDDGGDVVAVARHGDAFTAVVQRDNVFGVQFHPEKSHRHGMALLRSFFEL